MYDWCTNTVSHQYGYSMDTTEQYINFSRAKVIKRLLSNAFTREINKERINKERKDKKSIVNETVESIRKLINDYETINFQDDLFKLIKYNDTN